MAAHRAIEPALQRTLAPDMLPGTPADFPRTCDRDFAINNEIFAGWTVAVASTGGRQLGAKTHGDYELTTHRKTTRQPTVATAVMAFWNFGVALTQGQTISPSSTAKRFDRHMVLAGFRLAKLLNDTLGRMTPADFK